MRSLIRVLTFAAGCAFVIVFFARFAAGGRETESPAPCTESRAPGGMTAGESSVRAALMSRPATPRRPADPDRGADPGRAPTLRYVALTDHYRVSSDGSALVAEQAAELLEKAWPIWCRRFGLDEDYDAGEGRFSVRLFESCADMQAACVRETGFNLSGLGFVDFRTYRAFAFRHRSWYELRRIVLHEGTHQFLYRLIGSAAAELLPRWYDEGCAHECEKHLLDGDRLELFQHEGGYYSHQLSLAVMGFRSNLDVAAFFRGQYLLHEDSMRAYGWAVIHFMREHAGPCEASWFEAYEAALHRGFLPDVHAVTSRMGDAEGLRKRLVAFLEGIQ